MNKKLSAARSAFKKKFKRRPPADAHGSFKDKDLRIACLGRPVALGTLYDARNDRFITGTKLWSQAATLDMTKSQVEVTRTISIEKECTFSDKAKLLKLSPDLKLGFLCGNTEVEGSGRYLNDSKTSLNSEEVTLAYRIVTRFDELHLEPSGGVEFPQQLADTPATHVVTGIKFGANAFLVFEKERELLGEASASEESLESMVSALKVAFNESDAPPKYSSDFDDSVYDRVKCRYFGDFDVESPPTTLREAFGCVSSFSSDSAETPLVAYLTPLSTLGGKVVMLKRKITDEQLNEAGDYLQRLNDSISAAGTQQRVLASSPWQTQRAELSEFVNMVEVIKTRYTEKLLKTLPDAREHNKGCDKITKLLTNFRDNSPFGPAQLLDWISNRERECIALQALAAQLSSVGIKLIKDATDKQQFEKSAEQKLLVELNFPTISFYLKSLQRFLNGESNYSTVERSRDTWHDTEEHEKIIVLVNELVSIVERNRTDDKFTVSAALISEAGRNNTDRIEIIKKYRKGHQWCALEIPPPPKDLSCEEIKSTRAKFSWSAVKSEFAPAVQYRINIYVSSKKDSSELVVTKLTDEVTTDVHELDPSSKFKAKISTVTPFGDSVESRSVRFETLPLELCSEYVRKIMCESKPVRKEGDEAFPGEIFQLKMRLLKLPESCQCPADHCICPESFDIGACKSSPGKYLLVVGETGTGKTRFINALVNAFYKVEYKDNFRLRLISETAPECSALESTASNRISQIINQAHSQTSKVSLYTLHPVDTSGGCSSGRSALDCPLTVIDTPGFGDTRGLEEDQRVVKKIARVLGEDSTCIPGMTGILHAVGFVVKASQNRLTPTQKYIFDQVLSLFGKDIAKIILPVMTFADSNEPQALAALSEHNVPYKQILKFNNGVLYSDNSEPEPQGACSAEEKKHQMALRASQLDWEQAWFSYSELFDWLSKADAISLKTTRNVLRQRSTLEHSKEKMWEKVQVCFDKMALLEEQLNLVDTLDAVIKDADMNKTRKVMVPKKVKKTPGPGRYVMRCRVCENTCHNDCSRGLPESRKKCRVFTLFGNCSVCPKKCSWKEHECSDHYFVHTTEEEIVSVTEIFEKYELSVKDREAKRKLIETLREELSAEHQELTYNIVTIHKCFEALDQLALRQYPLGVVQYIDNLISSQEMEQTPGWQSRVKYLAEARKSAEMIAQTRRGEDPFGNKIAEMLQRCESATSEPK
ncbi:hypothetical protein BOX15_Mlig008863g1 [Macrostomum lignano]|uniref:Fibronectin type-III domain-containing protein n=1 Tax=Macrostomum lignano TaxID=282301 RepID=A0A267EG95_9PLAT|nr:hypothetical protein BOX15_Mlig008863g1 [Macrostomum lignano]